MRRRSELACALSLARRPIMRGSPPAESARDSLERSSERGGGRKDSPTQSVSGRRLPRPGGYLARTYLSSRSVRVNSPWRARRSRSRAWGWAQGGRGTEGIDALDVLDDIADPQLSVFHSSNGVSDSLITPNIGVLAYRARAILLSRVSTSRYGMEGTLRASSGPPPMWISIPLTRATIGAPWQGGRERRLRIAVPRLGAGR